MTRKIIGLVLGIIFLSGAFLLSKNLIDNNKRPVVEVPKNVTTVFTQSVTNGEIPIIINANGNLVASRKIELYAEVQGIFKSTKKPFKAGQSYRRGDVLLSIDSQEFYTSLIAQRSTLFDLITGMMPDLKFDYPASFPNWEAYLQKFDLEKDIPTLPEPVTDKEKYFVNGRQVVSTYYNIKNLEERYQKYKISAPFNGMLTESLVNPGTLIRSGQKLGEFVDLTDFELEVNVNAEFMDILKVGEDVALTNLAGNKSWIGSVKRVNGRIDQNTQTVQVYIGVKGDGLIEGMYLEANIVARSEVDAIEIPRNLLINESQIFVVEGDQLKLKSVSAVYFTDKTAIIKGLASGTAMLSRPVPGAYEGMLIKSSSSIKASAQ
ncbi:MAG: multidrug efflux pump subunit AcrA (membrane-fusion protein) [Candidatus Endobugula sp.]|jgi:multidrug efflux pump subunit AcrA (membrane-fusion protein)